MSSEYHLEFRKLVRRLAQDLSSMHTRILAYVYHEAAPGLSADDEPMDVLEQMQQANCFSYEHPEKLGEIMKEVGRNDLRGEVEKFISKCLLLLCCAAVSITHIQQYMYVVKSKKSKKRSVGHLHFHVTCGQVLFSTAQVGLA